MGFLGSFDTLFLVLQANYFEKISLILIFSLVNSNAPGLLPQNRICCILASKSDIW